MPAWGGFLTYVLTAKIDSFLRKAVRWGIHGRFQGEGAAPVKFMPPVPPPQKKKFKIRPSLAKIFC